MSKIKLLTIAVIGLLIMNLGILAFLFFSRAATPEGHRLLPAPEEVKYIIIDRLHFDNDQVAQYEKLVQAHQRSVRELDRQIRMAKNNLYASLAEGAAANVDSLQNRLAEFQRQIEELHYNHFADIKKLCKPGQMKYFDDLTKDLAKFFAPGRKNPPPPRD
jgi:periplasmic protein CpxP/Spy